MRQPYCYLQSCFQQFDFTADGELAFGGRDKDAFAFLHSKLFAVTFNFCASLKAEQGNEGVLIADRGLLAVNAQLIHREQLAGGELASLGIVEDFRFTDGLIGD